MSSSWFPQRILKWNGDVLCELPGQRRPLVFVHINKTAGTSLTQYLRGHVTSPDAMAPPWLGDFQAIGIDDPTRQLYWGHFTFARFSQHRPQAWFITFLRDPIQRVVSQYRSLHNPENLRDGWEKVLPEHARRSMQFAQRATFEQFVMSEDPFIVGHLHDLQTRFLSSYSDSAHPEFLSSALHNLQHQFLFFGITEQFEQSIRMFRHQVFSPHEYKRHQYDRNVSQRYRAELKGAVADRVESLTENDRQLYAFAESCFRRRVHRFDQQLTGQTSKEQTGRRAG